MLGVVLLPFSSGLEINGLGGEITLFFILIDPFMQGSESSPETLASSKLCFFRWMDGTLQHDWVVK